MVKYTKKCSSVLKPYSFGQMPKVVSRGSLNWIVIHGALYCCVRYSNIKYQDEIFKTYH